MYDAIELFVNSQEIQRTVHLTLYSVTPVPFVWYSECTYAILISTL